MKIDQEEYDSHIVLYVKGDINYMENLNFKSALEKAIKESEVDVVVDFNETTYIDSSGIGALLVASKKLTKQSRKLKIANCSKNVKDVISLTSLWDFLEV